jgi:hypothetical protein
MLDVDGTIYQTLDVKEKAYHAGVINTQSIGIEIANIGAYPIENITIFDNYYHRDNTIDNNRTRLIIPQDITLLNPSFSGRPSRDNLIDGILNGYPLYQYDFTDEQYKSLAHLTAALTQLFPAIKLDLPRDTITGEWRTGVLSSPEITAYSGIMAHYHTDVTKVDPGPAFNWNRFFNTTKSVIIQKQVDDNNAAIAAAEEAAIIAAALARSSTSNDVTNGGVVGIAFASLIVGQLIGGIVTWLCSRRSTPSSTRSTAEMLSPASQAS